MYKNIKWCIQCTTKIYINTLPPYKHDIRFTIIINKLLRFFMSVIFHVCWNNYADIIMLIFYVDITKLTYNATVTSLC